MSVQLDLQKGNVSPASIFVALDIQKGFRCILISGMNVQLFCKMVGIVVTFESSNGHDYPYQKIKINKWSRLSCPPIPYFRSVDILYCWPLLVNDRLMG